MESNMSENYPEKANLTLEQASIKDIPELISIEKEVANSHLYSPMLTEKEWVEAMNKNITFFIKVDNNTVGEVSYEIKDQDHAYIDGLVIMPSFQGQGIAKNAMKMILEKLKNFQEINLVTHPDNIKAVKLYTSLNFKIRSRFENYFGDGEPRIDMVLENKIQ